LNSQTKAKEAWTDQQIDDGVATILQYGVTSAAIIVSIGLALYLLKSNAQLPEIHRTAAQLIPLRSYLDLSHYLQKNTEESIILLGLSMLVATPIIRVMFSAYAFARQHDYVYVTITLIVTAILLYSIVGLKCCGQL
jgi:uncharacterized membrane protein